MKNLALILLFLFPILGMAQPQQTDKQKSKEEKRKEQHEKLMTLIDSGEFVFQANFLRDRYGNQVFVNETTNFVAVADSVGVIQIAFNNGAIGRNGLGGETIDGRITQYEVYDCGPGKGANIRMTLFGFSTFDLRLSVNDNGIGTIDLSGIYGQRLVFSGELLPLEGSDIFVGTTTF